MYKKRKLGLKLGISIPVNVFGPGLSLPHTGTIIEPNVVLADTPARVVKQNYNNWTIFNNVK